MYSTPPRVTPLTPLIPLGRLLAMVQVEKGELNTSVDDRKPPLYPLYPPVTKNICNVNKNKSILHIILY